MATVPIFAPDGSLGDIPQARLAEAIKAGAKPGVNVLSPTGDKGVVPADRLHEAAVGGAKLVPFEDQEVKHPGFWSALYDDLKGMGQSVTHLADYDPMTDRSLSDAEKMKVADQWAAQKQQQNEQRNAAGYGPVYRNVGAPAAEMLGVNIPGMEQSAAEGDVAGVAGHAAAVPTVMAATEGLMRGAPVAAEAAAPVLKTVGKRVPEIAGGAAGAYLGHASGILEGGLLGAIAGRTLGKSLWEGTVDLYNSWRNRGDATALNRPYAGETEPPPSAPVEAATSVAPAAKPTLQNLNGSPTAPAPTPAQVEQALNSALGGKPLVKNVPLRQQLQATAPKAPALPEGFTPVESSLLRGYKYDPASQEFTAVLKNGESYTHGEVTPEQVKAFKESPSQGAAWTKKIKQGAGTVLTKKNGQAVKTGTIQTAEGKVLPKSDAGMFDDLASILEQSLAHATAGKSQ